jgi:trans-aconitate methyltransferase
MNQNQWNAELYDSKHNFVSELAEDLVELLMPKSGEYILDLGCGTGHLTNKIASRGVQVIGIDSAPTMIEQAKENYPQLHFAVGDAKNLDLPMQFDAIFSNAVLHWIKEAEEVIINISKLLKPKGRFVAEFGGKGNVKLILAAIHQAVKNTGCSVDTEFNPWYFPSIGEYASLLEKHNLEVVNATLFERSTPLDGEQGMRNWIKMFGNNILDKFSTEQQSCILTDIEKLLTPSLYKDGTWFADYRRIRIAVIKQ